MPPAGGRAPIFGLLAKALLVAGLLALGKPAMAADNVFEVKNIAVDVTAKTAAQARQLALAEAERRAFYGMVARLTLAEDQERIPEISGDEISAYVRDFSVASEKASSVRYIAKLNYTFKDEEFRRLLRAYEVPFAETPSKPVAILPVLEFGATRVLWDTPNGWRDAWERRSAPAGLVPLLLPLGDLTDVTTIGADQATFGDAQALAAIANRYLAGDAMTVYARLGLDQQTSGQILTVILIRPAAPIPSALAAQQFPQRPEESLGDLYARAANATARRIEDLWKRANLIERSSAGVLAVTVPIGGLADWLAVQRQLAQIGVIKRTEIVLMSRQEVRVNLHYVGHPDQLGTALEQVDLSLNQEGGEWLVMPIGVVKPPRT
ncbi:MAG: DUF2066 domain-containing protein [Proteobacteria bacterium]|nr:DUF2066 domain-containing protein [Pseudomonadota bacterium]